MTSLGRVDFATLTPERFHTMYRSRRKPFIITGAFDGVKGSTLDAISGQLGAAEYNVRVYGQDQRPTSIRSSSMNQVPWPVTMKVDGTMRKLLGRA